MYASSLTVRWDGDIYIICIYFLLFICLFFILLFFS